MATPVFTLTRRFQAPPALVWRAWTEPDLVQRWYGPGVETVIHRFDAVVGGLWLNEMKMNGQSMYQRTEFVEVEAASKLVMLMANANADWDPIPSPVMENWPLALLARVTLVADGEGTDQTFEWTPHGSTPPEDAAFEAAMDMLGEGWGKGMDGIDEILAELN